MKRTAKLLSIGILVLGVALLFTGCPDLLGSDENEDDADDGSTVAASLELSQTTADVEVGSSVEITVTATDADGNSETYGASVEDDAVASVTISGDTLTITGVGAGTTSVTIDSESGESASIAVNVTGTASEATLSLDESTLSIYVGGSDFAIATAADADGEPDTLSASSDDENVATVSVGDEDGVDRTVSVTGIAAGEATITVTSGSGKTATFTVTVDAVEASGWTSLGRFDLGYGTFDLAMGADGTPFVLIDEFDDTDNSYRLSVQKYVNGEWSYVGNPKFSVNGINGSVPVSIVVDSQSRPAVIHADGGSGGYSKILTVSRFDGTEWQHLGDLGVTEEVDSQLLFDDSDNPIVVWSRDKKLYARKWDGSAWVKVGDEAEDHYLDSFYDDFVATVNGDGHLEIIVHDFGEITVHTAASGSWTVNEDYPDLTDAQGEHIIPSGASLYALYKDTTTTDSYNGTAAKGTSDGWTVLGEEEYFDQSEVMFSDPRFIIGADGNPYVAYPSDTSLKMETYDATSAGWTTVFAESDSSVSFDNDEPYTWVVDSSGTPYVAGEYDQYDPQGQRIDSGFGVASFVE